MVGGAMPRAPRHRYLDLIAAVFITALLVSAITCFDPPVLRSIDPPPELSIGGSVSQEY
jgi:hypothetical protein